MKNSKLNTVLDKVTYYFEVGFTFIILGVIVVKTIELIAGMFSHDLIILPVDFDSILSASFALVIGVEFTKMLYKHTPETIIDVLLFAIARQTVLYHANMLDMLIGVAAIAGLFLAKKYIIQLKQKKAKSNNLDSDL
ncbi:MAG: transporter [Oscillospiraceae bacterium]|jgi:hypothetical protein|nr:transporter [Oscillospiraceae bacterium]